MDCYTKLLDLLEEVGMSYEEAILILEDTFDDHEIGLAVNKYTEQLDR